MLRYHFFLKTEAQQPVLPEKLGSATCFPQVAMLCHVFSQKNDAWPPVFPKKRGLAINSPQEETLGSLTFAPLLLQNGGLGPSSLSKTVTSAPHLLQKQKPRTLFSSKLLTMVHSHSSLAKTVTMAPHLGQNSDLGPSSQAKRVTSAPLPWQNSEFRPCSLAK